MVRLKHRFMQELGDVPVLTSNTGSVLLRTIKDQTARIVTTQNLIPVSCHPEMRSYSPQHLPVVSTCWGVP